MEIELKWVLYVHKELKLISVFPLFKKIISVNISRQFGKFDIEIELSR